MKDMLKLEEVKALPKYRLWLRYKDGAKGEVDLSPLVGKGVFAAWKNPKFFNKAHIGNVGQVSWNDEIELCPDALYLQLTHQKAEDIFPSIRNKFAHA